MSFQKQVSDRTSAKSSGHGIRVIPYKIEMPSSKTIERTVVPTKNGDITVVVKHNK